MFEEQVLEAASLQALLMMLGTFYLSRLRIVQSSVATLVRFKPLDMTILMSSCNAAIPTLEEFLSTRNVAFATSCPSWVWKMIHLRPLESGIISLRIYAYDPCVLGVLLHASSLTVSMS